MSGRTVGGTALARLRRIISRVPRGKVITYGQVAAAGGLPGAARVTVWALHSAPGLPWHRVVAARGRIALPGADGREQRLRLEIEGVRFQGDRVRMELCNWTPPARSPRRALRAPASPRRLRRSRRSSRPRAERGRRDDPTIAQALNAKE